MNEAEAEILRQAVARFLAGESWRSSCVWLNDEGVQTTAGGSWQTMTLNAILKSARIAGLRQHKGVVVADAQWPGIITPRAAAADSWPLRNQETHEHPRTAPICAVRPLGLWQMRKQVPHTAKSHRIGTAFLMPPDCER